MNPLTRLFRSSPRKSSRSLRPAKRPRARLAIERLETRLMPANLFVVPVSQATDGAHFHTLAGA
jgi:hypothetical protein